MLYIFFSVIFLNKERLRGTLVGTRIMYREAATNWASWQSVNTRLLISCCQGSKRRHQRLASNVSCGESLPASTWGIQRFMSFSSRDCLQAPLNNDWVNHCKKKHKSTYNFFFYISGCLLDDCRHGKEARRDNPRKHPWKRLAKPRVRERKYIQEFKWIFSTILFCKLSPWPSVTTGRRGVLSWFGF